MSNTVVSKHSIHAPRSSLTISVRYHVLVRNVYVHIGTTERRSWTRQGETGPARTGRHWQRLGGTQEVRPTVPAHPRQLTPVSKGTLLCRQLPVPFSSVPTSAVLCGNATTGFHDITGPTLKQPRRTQAHKRTKDHATDTKAM